jgi:PadR family transcriptional regulator, regulatory protein PadR
MPKITRETQAVLAAFLRDPTKHRYGFDISKEAHLASGTIYPILARLEAAGWIKSQWEDVDESAVGRRARRYYKLTGEGARVGRESLRETEQRLSGVLRPNWGRA